MKINFEILKGQKEQLNRIEDNVDESSDLIVHGTRDLAKVYIFYY